MERSNNGARARRMRWAAVLAASILALGVAQAPSARAAVDTPKQNIQVWSVNIHRFKDPNWKSVIDRMVTGTYKPDIVLVQDIANTDFDGGATNTNGVRDSEEFRNAMNNKLGVTYKWSHSDNAQAGPNTGNTMVLWRGDRFDPNQETILRWQAASDNDGDGVCGNNDTWQIAVRLWDLKQTRWVTAASVHHPLGPNYRNCTYRNLRRANNNLESLSPTRRLTILGGDLNIRPDDVPPNVTPELPVYGQEANPDCWYRWTSAVHSNTVTPEDNYCDQGLDAPTDTYYDSAWVENGGANPSSAMCQQWTHAKNGATSGDACTDQNLDGLLDRVRIDSVWVRWEDTNGAPRPFTQSQAADIITSAGVDPANVDNLSTRYSDHRAVKTLVRWCLTSETC